MKNLVIIPNRTQFKRFINENINRLDDEKGKSKYN